MHVPDMIVLIAGDTGLMYYFGFILIAALNHNFRSIPAKFTSKNHNIHFQQTCMATFLTSDTYRYNIHLMHFQIISDNFCHFRNFAISEHFHV